LTHTSGAIHLDLNACACTVRAFARVSRNLLALITLSLVTMPFTEHFWTGDHFSRFGRDFELTTISLLSILLLVLVLSRSCKQSVAALLTARQYLARRFDEFFMPASSLAGDVWTLHRIPPSDRGACASSPLQI
jgi:hypothetical protein